MGYHQLNKGLEQAVKSNKGKVITFTNTKSLLLDGADEYVNIDDVQTALATTTVGTWSCWVKPVDATPTTDGYIISFGDTNLGSALVILINTSGKLRSFSLINGSLRWNLQTDNSAFSDNTWTHIVLVQLGTGVDPILYVDAVAVDQSISNVTNKASWFNDSSGLDNGRIGNEDFSSGAGGFFNGNIDEVIFINRALTQPQIADIYNSGSPKDESGIANGVSAFRMGDKGTYTGGVWTFPDQIGSNDALTVNCEEADVENDVP